MKMKTIIILLLFLVSLHANFNASISKITPTIKAKMLKGKSYRKGCPVKLKDLRYLRVTHKGFNYKNKKGELIVHKSVAKSMVNIFRELYAINYPIHKMKLVSNYHGKDWVSIEADNTSAFNCRNVGGTNRWSRHSYGKAIDINPIENPYVSRSGYISHKASLKYKKRRHHLNSLADRAVILRTDRAFQIFKKYGWQWGGNFKGEKDYQHFFKR